MKNNTSEKIVRYIFDNKQATAKELAEYFDISRQALFKHLSILLEKRIIIKIGKPPKVFYLINEEKNIDKKEINIQEKIKKIINDNYLIITAIGNQKFGLDGFVYWCAKNNFDVNKKAIEYKNIFEKYNKYKKNGLINGNEKLKKTFDKVYLDKIYYLDFYSVERFGKTKLGQLLLYAKQSQNKQLTKEIVKIVKPKIQDIIKKHKIDAVGFIPPTVKREIQFIKELKKYLDLNVEYISIVKIKTPLIIPQKTLNKLTDRIENAKKTIIVDEVSKYNNLLLIDDAIGSGATLNETAKQIKDKEIAKNIIGVSITGSFKGFDVISEI